MNLPTLYSRTSLGQVQQWTIEFETGKNIGRFRTHEGIQGGQITTSEWTECIGKNIGKKNETSPGQQAENEARAKHQKKIDKKYTPDIAAIDEETFFSPQLAKKWEDYADEVVWPVASQPKLDGTRMILSRHGAFSRNGKPIVSVPHVVDVFKRIFELFPELVFDGEIYNHALKHDFDRLMSLARQSKPTEEDLAASRAELQYHVYDLFDGTRPSMPFGERAVQLAGWSSVSGFVKLVETQYIHNQAELDTVYSQYLEAGYEGQMVRVLDSVYSKKRTSSLLKRKEWIDEEFELVDFEEGRGNLVGIAARAILKLKDGRTFEAGMIGSHAVCRKLLEEKATHIGKLATIKYQNLTPEGKPRFGKFKAMRDL